MRSKSDLDKRAIFQQRSHWMERCWQSVASRTRCSPILFFGTHLLETCVNIILIYIYIDVRMQLFFLSDVFARLFCWGCGWGWWMLNDETCRRRRSLQDAQVVRLWSSPKQIAGTLENFTWVTHKEGCFSGKQWKKYRTHRPNCQARVDVRA